MDHYRQRREQEDERARLRGLRLGHTPLAHTPANGRSVALQAIGATPRQNYELRAGCLVNQLVAYRVPQPTARLALAVAFPMTYGFNGGCTTIRDLDRMGLHRGHLGITPNMEAAVRLVMRAAMEAVEACGSGNRWQRRLHRMRNDEAARVMAGHAHPTDLNRAATVRDEIRTEGRVSRHRHLGFTTP